MDETGFRHFLKHAGKKEHVISGLVRVVRDYEDYLADACQIILDKASEVELFSYDQALPKNESKERLRGIALYYKFAGNAALATRASGLREEKIAVTRKSFKLGEFRGVDPQNAAKLEAAGINTVEDMLKAGSTPQDRKDLAARTGVSPDAVLELVKLSDISRLGAIKSIRARLYYDAGLDTPDKFLQWEPEPLREMLIAFVERTGFDGIAPLPKEIRNAIEAARKLPSPVTYE